VDESKSTKSKAMGQSVAVSKKNFPDQSARSFKATVKGRIFRGLVVKKAGKFYAYQNLCQHLPITLDLNDDKFFNHENTHLQCHMHGAMYELDTGICIAGPCVGAKLVSLSFTEEESRLVVRIPDGFED
jgi:nitrite reductase/ring-hydroxylating ferredoxin subunit